MVGAMSDVTQRKVEEERLKLLDSVIINANDAVMVTEADHLEFPEPKIVYVNEAFTRMTGYKAEEVIGKTPRILQGALTDKNKIRKLSDALKKFESHEVTTINYKKNGEPFWVNFTVTPLTNKKGVHTHFIAIERDVTN